MLVQRLSIKYKFSYLKRCFMVILSFMFLFLDSVRVDLHDTLKKAIRKLLESFRLWSATKKHFSSSAVKPPVFWLALLCKQHWTAGGRGFYGHRPSRAPEMTRHYGKIPSFATIQSQEQKKTQSEMEHLEPSEAWAFGSVGIFVHWPHYLKLWLCSKWPSTTVTVYIWQKIRKMIIGTL